MSKAKIVYASDAEIGKAVESLQATRSDAVATKSSDQVTDHLHPQSGDPVQPKDKGSSPQNVITFGDE